MSSSNVSKLLELSETSQARKLILGLRVIIYAKPTVADMTLPGRWYMGASKDLRSAHQCTVYITRSQVQVQMSSI